MAKWYDGLDKVQRIRKMFKPAMFFSGYGANNKLEPNKPTNITMVNGKPSVMHEGEIATNDSIIPANKVQQLTKPATTEKQQQQISSIQKQYGLKGYEEGLTAGQTSNLWLTNINRANNFMKSDPDILNLSNKNMDNFFSSSAVSNTTKPPETTDPFASLGLTSYVDKANEGLDRLKDISTYNDPYFRNLANKSIQDYRAAGAASGKALSQTLSTIPGLTEGARNAAMMAQARDVSSGESQLRGELAGVAGEQALQAASRYAELSQNLITAGVNASQVGAYIKNLESEQQWKVFDEAINEGNWEQAGITADELGFKFDQTRYQDKYDVDKGEYLMSIGDTLVETNPYLAARFYAQGNALIAKTLDVDIYDPTWTDEFVAQDQSEGGWGGEVGQNRIKEIMADLGKKAVDANGDGMLDISLDDYKQWKYQKELEPTVDENGNERLSTNAQRLVNDVFFGDRGLYNWISGDGLTSITNWYYNNRNNSEISGVVNTISEFLNNPEKEFDFSGDEDFDNFAKLMYIMYADSHPEMNLSINSEQADYAKYMGYNVAITEPVISEEKEITDLTNITNKFTRPGYMLDSSGNITVTNSEAKQFIGNPDYETTFTGNELVDDWAPRNIGKILVTKDNKHYLITRMATQKRGEGDTVVVVNLDGDSFTEEVWNNDDFLNNAGKESSVSTEEEAKSFFTTGADTSGTFLEGSPAGTMLDKATNVLSFLSGDPTTIASQASESKKNETLSTIADIVGTTLGSPISASKTLFRGLKRLFS